MIGDWSLVIFFSFAGKKVVAIELAVEFAVEEAEFAGGFESDTFHRGVIGGDDPRRGAGELVFEGGADLAVEFLHIFVGSEAFAVRRVNHHRR